MRPRVAGRAMAGDGLRVAGRARGEAGALGLRVAGDGLRVGRRPRVARGTIVRRKQPRGEWHSRQAQLIYYNLW